MNVRPVLDSLAALATIAGTAVSLTELHPAGWVVVASVLISGLAVLTWLLYRKGGWSLHAAPTVIEGHSIDSLNAANFGRSVNRSLFVGEAQHRVRIRDDCFELSWKYSGSCRKGPVSSFAFSIDADQSTPFDRLDCTAFDLGHDPDGTHDIRPLLTGTEGLSKKISVPFLRPLQEQEAFSILLTCRLPISLQPGFGYYTSTLSFAQDRIRRCEVELAFDDSAPKWVRVYESIPGKPTVLVKTLPPSRPEQGGHRYHDTVHDCPGRSARIYAFWREPTVGE